MAVYFVTDLAINRHGHEHELRVEARPEDASELGGGRGQRAQHVGEVGHFVFGRVERGLRERHRGAEGSDGAEAEWTSDIEIGGGR